VTGYALASTRKVRCDQNRLFGCGRWSWVPASVYVIGESRGRRSGGGPCQHCGLPLAVFEDFAFTWEATQ
jgi:hypothetical protein